ncbi:MAG: GMC family oxidoreductase [Gemmatimonadetes bacterium]|nr:GMC family oxidoreductase [Gemmatimonadota bacterium]
MQPSYDAIVVGSGMTGGWAAKELTERGLRTLVLEAGRSMDPDKDYLEHEPVYEFKFRGLGDRKHEAARQFIQAKAGPFEEQTAHFFVDDVENPYSFPDDKPFYWIRGRHLGGRSIMWGRQSYRLSDLDFEANAREGIGLDWPIRYRDIAPWYDHVEDFIGISGEALGLSQLPDGKFLPPMVLNCAEQVVKEGMARSFGGERVLTIGRTAILTVDHRGRAACHYCGPCWRGCATHSYFNSVHVTLPAARATGRLTIRPHSVVHSVVYDERRDRATGVRVIDATTKQELEFTARVIFLCASALESARILLNSKTPRFPGGLANSSGELGRNLMDHTMGGGARGTIPGNEDRNVFGRRPNGIYVPRFRNVVTRHPDFVRGYGFQGGAGRAGWERGSSERGLGAEFKHRLRTPGPWRFTFYGFGECLPSPTNRIELDPDKADAWGVPALKVHCEWGDNERTMMQDMAKTAAEMLEASGARDIETFVENNAPGLAIHEMGTARMGRDPRTSVLNANNQCHDVKNLFVTDGACMTSSGCQNPSLTYMALTARAAAYAVEQLNRREL